ncbi:hypothetical protein EV426DRAFT_619398 [Tirmania nivea]|nr:hypothetical protein EV426DRAFT_619398 [Tirmania nivea]
MSSLCCFVPGLCDNTTWDVDQIMLEAIPRSKDPVPHQVLPFLRYKKTAVTFPLLWLPSSSNQAAFASPAEPSQFIFVQSYLPTCKMKFGSITAAMLMFFFAASSLAAPGTGLGARQGSEPEPHAECDEWLDEMDSCYFDKQGNNIAISLGESGEKVTPKSRCAVAVAMFMSLDCLGWDCLRHDLKKCTEKPPKETWECHKKALSNCGIIIKN